MGQDMNQLFDQAYRAWWEYCTLSDVAESSSSQDYVNNRYFEDIVQLGRPAVPYILAKIRSAPEAHFLVFALERIAQSAFPGNPPPEISRAAPGNQGLAAVWGAWWEDRLTAEELALLRRLEAGSRRSETSH